MNLLKKNVRDSNMELFRVVSMLLVLDVLMLEDYCILDIFLHKNKLF